MRRSQRGYSSYRGRRTLTDILKIVAAVLGVLAVVLLVAVWIGGKDGLPLKLPDVSQQDGGQSDVSGDGQGDDQSGGTGSESGQEEPDTSQPEQPEEPEQESVMTALELPVSAILDGTAAAQLEQAGANALVLTMKDEEGMLAGTPSRLWPRAMASTPEMRRFSSSCRPGTRVRSTPWRGCAASGTIPSPTTAMTWPCGPATGTGGMRKAFGG